MPLINCEIELDLSCSRYCVVSHPAIQTVGATFQINNAKLYVSVVTLHLNDCINFLENVDPGFKRTISWNKCISEITT